VAGRTDDVDRTDDVAGRDTWQASVQDTWRHQDATRVMLIWHFGRTIGQLRGDTCHHSQGDTWHADVSMLTWQMTWQVTGGVRIDTWQHGKKTRGSTAGDVASRQVTRGGTASDVAVYLVQSERDTCQLLVGEKRVPRGPLRGSHVAPHGWWLVLTCCLRGMVPCVWTGVPVRRRGFHTGSVTPLWTGHGPGVPP
jgi:hypothetical protein